MGENFTGSMYSKILKEAENIAEQYLHQMRE